MLRYHQVKSRKTKQYELAASTTGTKYQVCMRTTSKRQALTKCEA